MSIAQISVTQDNTTMQLARIWEKLLGVESVGLQENYFDLGGDSILAVQLFAQIEMAFAVKLPVATLFEAPTVEELAGILRRNEPVSNWSPLVAIHPAGSRPPFFCVHGAGGNVLIYRDLARHLGPEQPFYGLQCQGLDGSCPPLTRIEDMAALYVKEIRKVQPQGPYFLGGYCGGGTIAFEVAQQLQSLGEQIALLALFDTSNWSKIHPSGIWGQTYYACQRFVFHVANFLRLDWEGKVRFFREKVQVVRNRIPVWRGLLLARFGKASGSAKSASQVLGQIWRANDGACWNYVPKPYPGVVTDFRPVKQYRMFDKPDAKWDGLAQEGQDVFVLPVYPAGMLLEPFVKYLAVALNQSIERATRVRDAA